MRRRVLFCALLAALLALGFVYREPLRMIWYSNVDPKNPLNVDGWTDGKTYQNVQYSDISASDYLNLYVPDTENPPLLVLVHGGGFVTNDCESRQAQLMYQYFRDHGWACATVNYRLAQEAAFPAAVEDVKCALRYLRANAEAYGYDADRVAIWGESAGGYLAVMAGVTTDEEFNSLPFVGETEPVSAKVDAIIDYYGAVLLETKAEPKHFAFNHQESNRSGLSTFLTEQAARENELRGFQMSLSSNSAQGLMTAFNRAGKTFDGAYRNLLVNIVRDEWGYTGWIVTDMINGADYMNWRDVTAGGGGGTLTTSAYDTSAIGAMAASKSEIEKDVFFQEQMKDSLRYYLYNIAQSNAMNGLSSTTQIVYITTWYERALQIATWSFAGLTALCLVIAVVKDLKPRKKT